MRRSTTARFLRSAYIPRLRVLVQWRSTSHPTTLVLMSSYQPRPPSRPRLCRLSAVLVAIAMSVLVGCGSSAVSPPASSKGPPSAPAVHSTSSIDGSRTSAAAPSLRGPPSFIVNLTTADGDKVTVVGRFGRPLPAAQSDVDQTALSECPPPAADGRAVVVRLDLTTTLESRRSTEVALQTGYITPHLINFVMGSSEGPGCDAGEPGSTSVSLGQLRPHQLAHFTMWVVLPDAITPHDRHPSDKTLGAEDWLMAIPKPTLSGAVAGPNQHDRTTGPRLVICPRQNEANEEYIAVVGDTPKTLNEPDCPIA